MPPAKYSKLFEPGTIGKVKVKNRIVFAPLCTNFAQPLGLVSERVIKYYTERAKGGVGLFILENSRIIYPKGTILVHNLRLDDDNFIAGFQELSEAVHGYGAKVFQQINDAGRQTKVQAVGPSSIPCEFLGTPVKELTRREIWDFVATFSEVAWRVKQAGLDGVEFHGAHGYLINNFLSPYTNKRTDEWGGTFERRMKFILEIIKRTREKVGPDFPLGLRYSADECVPGGITLEEGVEIARTAEAAGIDVLNVSAGIYESMQTIFDTMRYEEGWRVYMADAVKKSVKIPVITVGQIKTPSFAEQVLREGKADFIALGRPLVADAEWAQKARDGREEDIRKCISCNHCFGKFQQHNLYMRCAVNPVVGHEKDEGWVELKPAANKKKVMIVGGGPAGMEAARVTSLRGHEVTLYEKDNELGGQLKLAAASPGKDKVNYIKEYYSTQLPKSGVNISLRIEVDKQLVSETKPDVIIIATGAEPRVPEIHGASSPKAFTYSDVLSGKAELPGNRVVVAGGGMVGCETALYLAAQGKKVIIVEMLDELATDMELTHRFDMLSHELPEAGVEVFTRMEVTEITDNGVTLMDRKGSRSVVEADNVVIAMGAKSLETLKDNVEDIVPEVYVIGDCSKPRTITDATCEGAVIARLL